MKLFQSSSLLLAATASSAIAAYVPGKAFDRFITIWLENQDFFKTAENTDIKVLTEQGILLTSFYGLTHPSQPNYIASVGGDYFGLDKDYIVNIPKNISNIADLFDSAHIPWKSYMDSLPSPGFQGEGAAVKEGKWQYYRKHNPLISFENISGNETRRNNIQSLDAFFDDLKANNLPQWAHISPSIDDDGHDTGLSFASNWTRNFLEPLLNNSAFMEKTLVLLTFDESESYRDPNRILSLLLGGAIPSQLRNTTDSTYYNHYSMISTMEANWGLPNLGRFDVGANVFELVANKTGYKNAAIDTSKVLLNQSYNGFLASKPQNRAAIPAPILTLPGAGGKGVLDSIKQTWQSVKAISYYNGSVEYYDGFNNKPVYATPDTTSPSKSQAAFVIAPTYLAIGALGAVALWQACFM